MKRQASDVPPNKIRIGRTGVVVVGRQERYKNLLPQSYNKVKNDPKQPVQVFDPVEQHKKAMGLEKLKLLQGLRDLVNQVRKDAPAVTENRFFLDFKPSFLKMKFEVGDKDNKTFSLPKAWLFLDCLTATYLKKEIMNSEDYILLPRLNRADSMVFCSCVKYRFEIEMKPKSSGKVTFEIVETKPDHPDDWATTFPEKKRLSKKNIHAFMQQVIHILTSRRIEFVTIAHLKGMKDCVNKYAKGKLSVGNVFFSKISSSYSASSI